ncbi:MAG: prepilin-type N-terminal cleavage/methylation domain-containing protein [Lactobacillales bacterium]|jgi:competence protein ComGC|nr:prepilin-type N-terminal cleavage/methylation domain-containing protein [Lactobacillales bacterium]
MKKKLEGFTLIEVLTVLVVVGLLMMIFIPNLTKQKEKIDEKGGAAIVKVVETQMDVYEIEHEARPSASQLAGEGYITPDQLKQYEKFKK